MFLDLYLLITTLGNSGYRSHRFKRLDRRHDFTIGPSEDVRCPESGEASCVGEDSREDTDGETIIPVFAWTCEIEVPAPRLICFI